MQPLTTTITTKDATGRVIGEKEVATYAGLLTRAHDEGLKRIETMLTQVPHADNGWTAICGATVETSKGVFTGIGDANPDNVGRKIVPHLIRMAETRAKARALRDAVNIGIVSMEELGGEGEADTAPSRQPARQQEQPAANTRPQLRPLPDPASSRPSAAPPPQRQHQPQPVNRAPSPRDNRASEAQIRYLYRMLAERGFEGEQATFALCEAAQVRQVSEITREDASALIEVWKQDGRSSA